MSTLIDTPVSGALSEGGFFVVEMSSGKQISFPISENPRLRAAAEEDLRSFQLSPLGIHWPTLDEDLSVRGLLEGNWGQEQRQDANKSQK
jgi:hypothetical protein